MNYTHELKVDADAFPGLWSGAKKAELRRNDRGFKTGDILQLREDAPEGRFVVALVTHIIEGYGLAEGYVMLSLQEVNRSWPDMKRAP